MSAPRSRQPESDPRNTRKAGGSRHRKRWVATALLVPLIGTVACNTGTPSGGDEGTGGNDQESGGFELGEVRSLDGSANNRGDFSLGSASSIYPRVADARYADGVGEPVEAVPERYLSNRIFNDTNQNLFSENQVTHWGFVWGQFIDHTIGLRETSDEDLAIAFDPEDPLESFINDLGSISTTRSAAAEGTGVESAREQVNTISSYIDGWAIYGGSDDRLDWLREGSLDGDPTNNEATLLESDGYLPTAADRAGAEAPEMELMGRLMGDPESAIVAGDVRANENIGLAAVHTLLLREHNRIVADLPADLDSETKFQIARRVVGAMQQYITYNEFLPAVGVELDPYAGYDDTVDPSITNEFATVGYRAHSQIHGEFEAEIPLSELGDDGVAGLEGQGIEVTVDGDVVEVAVPLNVAFGNPALVEQLGLGNLLAGLASEAAYANDEQIDNQLRSVLFQVPGPATENPMDCLDGEGIENCFSGVNDLGALDVARARDHGMPSYNEMRVAYGLDPIDSFVELTGEDTSEFADDPEIDQSNPIDDPDILDVLALSDIAGNDIELGTDAADGEAVTALRRSTTAARLAAIFDSVDDVDAFTGMVSEQHVEGSEFGELQLAMWTAQFSALRDGDRFFHENDPLLDEIRDRYGIDYRRSLGSVISDNTGVAVDDLPQSVFVLDATAGAEAPAGDEPEGEEPAAEGATPEENPDDGGTQDDDSDGDSDEGSDGESEGSD
ncbi:MAG: peroxidase family protein, partial [Microthrixaceae bacterium]